MSEPFLGEIILVGFTFAPVGYALCDGQVLLISQNSALFQLIGTTYGGDGITTFRLPDLRSRVAMGPGQGPGLTNWLIGDASGTEQVTLTVNQIPNHTHAVNSTVGLQARCKNGLGDLVSPLGNVLAIDPTGAPTFRNTAPDVDMHPNTITIGGSMTAAPTGGSQPHNNVQPYLAVNFCIALSGIVPA